MSLQSLLVNTEHRHIDTPNGLTMSRRFFVFPAVAVLLGAVGLSCNVRGEGKTFAFRVADRMGNQFLSDEIGRTPIVGLSGERLCYDLTVMSPKSARLGLGEVSWARDRIPKEALRSNGGFHVSTGDVFPFLGQFYEVVGIQHDGRIPKPTPTNDRGSLDLRVYDAERQSAPSKNAYVLTRANKIPATLWGRRIPNSRIINGNFQNEIVLIDSWELSENSSTADVNFRTVLDLHPAKPPETKSTITRSLKVGDTFTELGVTVRVEQIVPQKDLDDGRQLVGWMSFVRAKAE